MPSDYDCQFLVHTDADAPPLWEQPTQLHPFWMLQHWLRAGSELGLRPLTRLCKTLQAAQDRILAYYLCPISAGPLDGINTKIRVLNRRSYGHRDLEILALRILLLHDTKFALSST